MNSHFLRLAALTLLLGGIVSAQDSLSPNPRCLEICQRDAYSVHERCSRKCDGEEAPAKKGEKPCESVCNEMLNLETQWCSRRCGALGR